MQRWEEWETGIGKGEENSLALREAPHQSPFGLVDDGQPRLFQLTEISQETKQSSSTTGKEAEDRGELKSAPGIIAIGWQSHDGNLSCIVPCILYANSDIFN